MKACSARQYRSSVPHTRSRLISGIASTAFTPTCTATRWKSGHLISATVAAAITPRVLIASRHGPCCNASCSCPRPISIGSLTLTIFVPSYNVFITPTPSTFNDSAATSHNRCSSSSTSKSEVDISDSSPTAQLKFSATINLQTPSRIRTGTDVAVGPPTRLPATANRTPDG